MSTVPAARAWPAEGLARVPYWIYQDEDIYRREQERIYYGDTWNFLGLDAELPEKGDFKTTFVGEMPVVVTREDRKSTRLNSSHVAISYAVFCLKKKKYIYNNTRR